MEEDHRSRRRDCSVQLKWGSVWKHMPPPTPTSPFHPHTAGNVRLGTTFEVSLQRAARERVAGVD